MYDKNMHMSMLQQNKFVLMNLQAKKIHESIIWYYKYACVCTGANEISTRNPTGTNINIHEFVIWYKYTGIHASMQVHKMLKYIKW